MVFALLVAAILWKPRHPWWFGLPASSRTHCRLINGRRHRQFSLCKPAGNQRCGLGLMPANIGKSLVLSPIVGFRSSSPDFSCCHEGDYQDKRPLRSAVGNDRNHGGFVAFSFSPAPVQLLPRSTDGQKAWA